MSIILFSLGWKYGILISCSCMCNLVMAIPFLKIVYSKFSNIQTFLPDRSVFFIPVPLLQNTKISDIDNLMEIKTLRIFNKVKAMVIIGLVLILQYVLQQELLPFPQQDLW